MAVNGNNPMFHVTILSTGGTIEKTYSERDGALANRDSIIVQRLNEALRLPYTHVEIKVVMSKDSLEMTAEDRLEICQTIRSYEPRGRPLIILHGTDTLEQTVELCRRELPSPAIPVIFTGAMKPPGFRDSDAFQNVAESLALARVLSPGVYVAFHSRVFSGTPIRKNRGTMTFEAY